MKIVENFPGLERDVDIQIHESERTPRTLERHLTQGTLR